MSGKIDWELIIKYLDTSHTPEDEKKLDEWVRFDQKNQQTLEKIKKIWNTPDLTFAKPDTVKAWHKLAENINFENDIFLKTRQLPTKQKPMPVMQLILSNRLFKIAAVILLILTIPYIASRFTKPTPLVEIIVPAAQKMILTLLDGSKVTLDAGTVFQYPEKFDSHQREVYLNGEGYFDVTSNSDAPFVVHTDNAIITVMGTKFNVRSWKHNHQDKVTVAVVEGRVSLRPENVDHHDANVIISEGQSSELIENSYPSTPQFIDTNKSLSWLRREMYFQNVPLRDVLDQLERWYGYEIFLPDSSFFKSQVTVYIENKPIEENLEIISMMYDLQFKQEGIKIVFSKTN